MKKKSVAERLIEWAQNWINLHLKMAGSKKAMDIVGERGVGSPRLRCTARLKSGQAMLVRLLIVICILRLERMPDVTQS